MINIYATCDYCGDEVDVFASIEHVDDNGEVEFVIMCDSCAQDTMNELTDAEAESIRLEQQE